MGWRNSQVPACDRRLLRGDDFHALGHWSPEECEGGRQAKVGENATGGLQHMGALRPDLPIEAMVKMMDISRSYEAQIKMIKEIKSIDENGASLMRIQS